MHRYAPLESNLFGRLTKKEKIIKRSWLLRNSARSSRVCLRPALPRRVFESVHGIGRTLLYLFFLSFLFVCLKKSWTDTDTRVLLGTWSPCLSMNVKEDVAWPWVCRVLRRYRGWGWGRGGCGRMRSLKAIWEEERTNSWPTFHMLPAEVEGLLKKKKQEKSKENHAR